MDAQAGSFAKVTPPAIAKATARNRLYKMLDSSSELPACWVAGPAGSGKTTLVATYLQHLKIPCLWYQVDEGDADPASFFYYMGLGVKKAVPRLRKTLPLLVPEYLQGLSVFARRFFEALYNLLGLPAVVVFDNYERASGDAAIHEILRHGLDIIPNGVRVFLCSRTGPPPNLTRLRANGQMAHLDWQDLRLTFDEALDIAAIRSRSNIDPDTVLRLYKQSDGWAAGFILMMEKVRPLAIEMTPSDADATAEIFDYFAGEIFAHSSKELQTFLLSTAFLPEFSLDMVHKLSRNNRARTLLSSLERKNYFITRHVHRETFYRFHPLFRDFLKAKAQEILTDESLKKLQHRSANVLEKAGQIDSAAMLWMETKDWDALEPFIMRHGKALLGQGRFQVLASWLEGLPREVVENNPWLLFFESLCRLRIEPREAYKLAARAYNGFKERRDLMGTLFAWTAVIDCFVFTMAGFKDLDYWIAELESYKSEYEKLPVTDIKAKTAISMFWALSFRQPRHPEIVEWAKAALSLSDELEQVDEMIKIRFQITWFHISYTGDLVKADGYLKEMQQLARKRTLLPMSQLMVHFSECHYYQISTQPLNALAAGAKGLELARKTGVHILDPMFLWYLAICHLDTGNVRDAIEHINAVEKKLRPFDLWVKFLFQFAKARYFLMRGKLREAEVLIDQNLNLKEQLSLWFDNTVIDLQKAQLLCLQGDHRLALTYTDRAMEYALELGSPPHKSFVLFEKAHIELALGEVVTGLQSLQEALKSFKRMRLMINCVLDLPVITAHLCAFAIENGIETDYAREIILKRKLITEKTPVHLEDWPWLVKISTLGSFNVLREHKAIRFGRKTPQKPLEMLKLLITLGGHRVSEEAISDILWQDADGDNAYQAFKTTLHRLRKLLGHAEAITRRGGRITLDSSYVWTDLWAFESLHTKIISSQRTALEEDDLRQTWIFDCQKALDLYKGDFLPVDNWAPPIIAKRDQLRRWFIHIAQILGQYLEASGESERAVLLYEKVLSKYEGSEFIFGSLMNCYLELGKKNEALNTYARCRSALLRTSGVKPSPWVEEIHRSIKKSEWHVLAGSKKD